MAAKNSVLCFENFLHKYFRVAGRSRARVFVVQSLGSEAGVRCRRIPQAVCLCLIARKEVEVRCCSTSHGVRSREMPEAFCLCLVAGSNRMRVIVEPPLRSET